MKDVGVEVAQTARHHRRHTFLPKSVEKWSFKVNVGMFHELVQNWSLEAYDVGDWDGQKS